MLNKKIIPAILAVSLMIFISGCGQDNNYTVDETENTEIEMEFVEEAPEIPVDEEAEASQRVTIKADAGGKPISASLKKSDDDMEENVDTEDIPFEVKVTYYLEDEEVTADEIAGATGNIRIRFDYVNMTGAESDKEKKSSMVPFAFVTLASVSDDKLYNIEVTNGGVTDVSGTHMIYGYAVPGIEKELGLRAAENKIRSLNSDSEKDDEFLDIPEYVEISGYAVDFSLDFTATLVSNGLLKDMDLKDINELSDGVKDLGEFTDKGNEFKEGASELKDGASKFGEGLAEYVKGASALNEGAKALSDGASGIYDGTSELSKGANTLAEGASTLKENSKALNDGAKALKDGLETLYDSLDQSGTGTEDTMDSEAMIQGISSDAKEAVLEALSENEELSPEEKEAISELAAGAAAYSAAEDLKGIISQASQSGTDMTEALKESIGALKDGAKELKEGVSQYTDGADALSDGAVSLKEGISELKSGAKELSEGAEQLKEGTGELSSSGSELRKAYASLESGIGTVEEAIDEMNEKLFRKIGSLSEGALPETLDRLKAMRKADKGFTAWNTYDGDEGSIVFILETEEIK